MGFEIENSRPELSAKDRIMEQSNLEELFKGLPEFAMGKSQGLKVFDLSLGLSLEN